MKIRGASVVVTGAGGGLGTCLIHELLRRGAVRVYAGGRTEESSRDAVEIDPEVVSPMVLDITSESDAAAAAATASDANLVFNNAGVIAFGAPLEVDLSAVEHDFRTNVIGTLRVTQAFAPVLEANGGGTIVNTLSLLSLAPVTGMSPYCASKAAAHSFTQSLRHELAARGIAVLGVYPGPMDTPMLAGVKAPKARPEAVAKSILDAVEAGQEYIAPDDFSAQAYAGYRSNPESLETMLAAF
ncbi:MAG: SDR family NAD(P)-dependent oxidoreductase [Solirubrobacterales bacterium]|nr:SDR family NAD(P)-dependent oxidoreductase [Solirubrobacterales bacterium]MBV9165430.1 SDR family NAD(P)-dependent oxidoreductase [Solirubrobacterales bacterium]MBV9533918.1 SDR family NAD(P)-dependent oxidoreductase [Solirubrobacterales bacterium]